MSTYLRIMVYKILLHTYKDIDIYTGIYIFTYVCICYQYVYDLIFHLFFTLVRIYFASFYLCMYICRFLYISRCMNMYVYIHPYIFSEKSNHMLHNVRGITWHIFIIWWQFFSLHFSLPLLLVFTLILISLI